MIQQLPYINHDYSLTIPTMALTYPKQYKNDINLNTQNRAIINLVNAKQQDLNGFLLHCIAHYKDRKYDDTIL